MVTQLDCGNGTNAAIQMLTDHSGSYVEGVANQTTPRIRGEKSLIIAMKNTVNAQK